VSQLRARLADAEASQREFLDLEEQLAEAERARAAATHALDDAEARLEALEQARARALLGGARSRRV
jgi:predicted  nucleic acid-binding Zn-ribbon protein